MTAADDHLDLDAIAALDEGLADDEAAARAHVDGCPQCGQRLARIRTTRALLSALPPEPMPEPVAARVHDALPREPVTATIVPAAARRRRFRRPSLAGLGAVAAGVALIAAIVIGATRGGGDGGSGSGANGAGAALLPRTPAANYPLVATGTRYTADNAARLVGRLDSAVHAAATPSAAPSTDSLTPGAASAGAAKGLSLDSRAAVPAELGRLHDDPQALLECVRALAGGGSPLTPLVVDFARFSGGPAKLRDAPAAVIVVSRFDGVHDAAYIVGPQCTATHQDIYAFEVIRGSG